MLRIVLAAFAALLLSPGLARADVASAAAGGFVIEAEAEVAASPDAVWRDLARVGRWWNSAHTYSGAAANMRLDPRAGGCWCERWAGGSVEHGRVLAAFTHEGARTLRLEAALGPLQELSVQAVLSFTIIPAGDGSKVTMSYRVAGDPALNLEVMAAPVNGVMMEQFDRLVRYSGTGSPD